MPPVGRNQRPLGLRVRAPEHKHHWLRALRDVAQQRVGQQLPTLAGVAGGLGFFHRQAGVEQQHALLRPRHQTAPGCRERWRRHT